MQKLHIVVLQQQQLSRANFNSYRRDIETLIIISGSLAGLFCAACLQWRGKTTINFQVTSRENVCESNIDGELYRDLQSTDTTVEEVEDEDEDAAQTALADQTHNLLCRLHQFRLGALHF